MSQGRARAIRLRNWRHDITAIVIYWSPKPQDASTQATYAETRHCLVGWVRLTIQDTPKRSTLHHDGPQRSDGRSRNDDENQAVTRDLLPDKEGQAPSLFRDILQEEGMAVINTFQGGEATFGSTRGTLPRIDHIAAPAKMAKLNLCRVQVRTGIRQQLIRSTRRHDHYSKKKKTRARKSERRASVVCRGPERELDERAEKTGSDRRHRRGA